MKDLIKIYHKNLINALQERGWALYYTEPEGFLTEEDLKICIEKGNEKEYLIPGVFYSIFPYIKNDTDWVVMRELMLTCAINNRYPFFIDMEMYEEADNDYVVGKGAYLVDSIVFSNEDNTFELVLDRELMVFLNIKPKERGNIIMLFSEAAQKIRQQLTLQKRGNE